MTLKHLQELVWCSMFHGKIWYIDVGCTLQSANLAIEDDEAFESTFPMEDEKMKGVSSAKYSIFILADCQKKQFLITKTCRF